MTRVELWLLNMSHELLDQLITGEHIMFQPVPPPPLDPEIRRQMHAQQDAARLVADRLIEGKLGDNWPYITADDWPGDIVATVDAALKSEAGLRTEWTTGKGNCHVTTRPGVWRALDDLNNSWFAAIIVKLFAMARPGKNRLGKCAAPDETETGQCGNYLEKRRSNTKYCSPACRERARRVANRRHQAESRARTFGR